jgi:hypothetical protein
MGKLMQIAGIINWEGYIWNTLLPSLAKIPQLAIGTGTPRPI